MVVVAAVGVRPSWSRAEEVLIFREGGGNEKNSVKTTNHYILLHVGTEVVREEKELLERCRNSGEISYRGLRCTAGGEWRGELQVFESAEAGGGEIIRDASNPTHPRLWCKK